MKKDPIIQTSKEHFRGKWQHVNFHESGRVAPVNSGKSNALSKAREGKKAPRSMGRTGNFSGRRKNPRFAIKEHEKER